MSQDKFFKWIFKMNITKPKYSNLHFHFLFPLFICLLTWFWSLPYSNSNLFSEPEMNICVNFERKNLVNNKLQKFSQDILLNVLWSIGVLPANCEIIRVSIEDLWPKSPIFNISLKKQYYCSLGSHADIILIIIARSKMLYHGSLLSRLLGPY